MRKKRPLTAVAEVVSRVLSLERPDGAPHRGTLALRVFSAFQRIGPPIVDHADPVLFRRGVLTLQVAESAWMTELSFLARQIQQRMNAILGRDVVKEVRFRLGPLAPRPEPPPKPRPVPAEAKAKIAAWSGEITRSEVREAVVRAAERFAAMPPRKMIDVSGPPGPRATPTELLEDVKMREEANRKMPYGYGDKPRDRWKNKKPRW